MIAVSISGCGVLAEVQGKAMRESLQQLAELSTRMYFATSDEGKVALRRVAERNRTIYRVYALYGVLTLCAGFIATIILPSEHGHTAPGSSSLWTYGVLAVKVVLVILVPIHHYGDLPVLLNVSTSSAAVLRCIGRGLEVGVV
ncbi:hypothetical protein ONE63_001017 [Megalurothrips usitatus]|uniref:Uncharacterized protein n=1 Tax=Megalurothrips usitatus TaxID=439358 RepID=A0AAV7XF70_9NEOP|nr:hypothetical protein ONE63_001017 [Megalurothrips usitatus]